MAKFSNHTGVIRLLRKAQSVEHDNRDIVREVHEFLDKKDGQWDSHAAKAFKGRPRYTLDKCNDLVDDIAGPIEQSDFGIEVLPAGGDATKELAKTYDGMIRNIENLSDAQDIYDAANRMVVRAGMDGWRVVQKWGDNNTFDQDLYFEAVADWVDRVWFDPGSVLQTREDANYAFVLQSMIKADYDEKFPKGSGQSVSMDSSLGDSSSPEVVVVGEILYKVRVTKTIIEFSNQSVYIDDEKLKKIKDELKKQGVTETRRREREMVEVKTRIFDGSGWLTAVQDTVFDLIPLVPQYANWSIRRKVPQYWGIVTKKLDAQRIYNYTQSRMVEEGALAPVAKLMITTEQIGANREAYESMNVSDDAVLPYEHQAGQSDPYKIGGAQINPGLMAASASMEANLQSNSGIDQLTGQPPGLQSGLAVDLKQKKGDTRNYKYTRSAQTARCYGGKIMMRAIPRVYDTKRQVRVINEDKSFEIVTLNDAVINEQTKERVEVIDLSKGAYDVTCNVSKSFKNRQSEMVSSLIEVAAIDPSILEIGRDVFYRNMTYPGSDVLAERVRHNMLLSGAIPEEEMTDDEKEFLAAQSQPEPDPVAQALEREADNADDRVQLDGIEEVRKEKETDAKIASDVREQDRKDRESEAKIANESLKTALAQMQAVADELKTHADAWKAMREAMGLESISGPGGIQAFIEQAAVIRNSQREQL